MAKANAFLTVLCAALVAACGSGAAQRAPTEAELTAAADSATAAELARFRTGLVQPTALGGGESSVESLVAAFVSALEAADTAALVRMHLSDAEFAWLYYPDSPYARRPLRQDPAVLWLLLRQNSEKGIARALRSFGARDLAYRGTACEAAPKRQGPNRLWERCLVTVRSPDADASAPIRLFGSILERGGRYRFVSYANDL